MRTTTLPVWRGAIVLVLASSLVGPPAKAVDTWANAEPETQSHAYGVSSNWHLFWGGTAPYHYRFTYGDGGKIESFQTWIVQRTTSHKYYPCYPETFTQRLDVNDANFGHDADSTIATEGGGVPC